MTRTKWLRRALLGGAALSVMATGAQADELAALKAQLEALQARVSEIETQPAPVLPAGASMLTVRRGQLTSSMILPLSKTDALYGDGQQGYTIAVTPTADMPAPVSEVTVSAQIRARLLYSDDIVQYMEDGDFEDYNGFDVNARGRLTVDGKTETAIGEVGGTIRLESGYDDDHPFTRDSSEFVSMDIAWGYWQMTPNFQLGGGYGASTGSLQAGPDWEHNNDVTGGINAFSNADNEQIRLTYQSGGLTLAVAVEDNDAEDSSAGDDIEEGGDNFGDVEGDVPMLAGYGLFDTGSFVIAAAASWTQDDREDGQSDVVCDDECDDDFAAGIGVNGKLGEMFSFTVAGAIGEGNSNGIRMFTYLVPGADDEWWAVTGGVIFSFAEALSLQLGAGYIEIDPEGDGDETEALDVTANLSWDPVDQLTLVVGAGWHDNESAALEGDDWITGGFGAYFRF